MAKQNVERIDYTARLADVAAGLASCFLFSVWILSLLLVMGRHDSDTQSQHKLHYPPSNHQYTNHEKQAHERGALGYLLVDGVEN